MSGWIKLHRQLRDWEWYKDHPTCKLFFHLLLSANHKSSRWQGVSIMPGQIVVGRKSLAYETGLSEQQIRTSLDKLKSSFEITIKTTSKYSIISITKWSLYQSDQPADQPATQPTSNQQSTTNKNDNNAKKKEVITPLPPKIKTKLNRFDEFWDLYPRQRRGSKDKALISYLGAIKRGNTEQQIITGVKTYAASSDVNRGFAKGCAAWLNDDGFNNHYQPVESSQGSSTGKRSGFDALNTAATKIQEDVEGQELDYLRRTDTNLYLQRLLDQSRGTGNPSGSSDAPNTIEHDAAPLGIGYSEGGSTD